MSQLLNAKPHGGSRGAGRIGNTAYLNRVSAMYGANRDSDYLPQNWRDRLPDPASYYARHLDKLGKPDASGWASALCPFHDDHSPSLRAHVAEGGAYRCMACGVKGRDIVAFHMAHTGRGFKEAVRDLLGTGARE